MALPNGVARWTISGALTAEEVWAIDWWTQPGTGYSSAQQWADTVTAMLGVIQSNSLHTNLAGLMATGGNVQGVSGLYYKTSQTAEYSAQALLGTPAAGAGTSYMPLQQCFCITTLTPRPGGSYRGRMYLPATGMTLDSNRRFNGAALAAVVNSVKGVLSAGNTVGLYGPPVVVSRTKTVATQITAIRYDLKPDIQRRRANRQSAGTRTVVAVP